MCNDLNDYPEAIEYFLNDYFVNAIKIIENNQGVLDKFIGDGIFAYFGYNSRRKIGDPYNAIRAAFRFRNRFPILKNQFKKFCAKHYGIEPSDYNLKCGMHNGPAFLDYFSTSTRNSIILMGPTVNFASRLQGIAKNDEIVISKQLRNMVEEKFDFFNIQIKDRLEEQSGKGKLKSFEDEDIVFSITGRKEFR